MNILINRPDMNLNYKFPKMKKIMMSIALTSTICLSNTPIGATNFSNVCCTVSTKLENSDLIITATKCRSTAIDACDAAYREVRKLLYDVKN